MATAVEQARPADLDPDVDAAGSDVVEALRRQLVRMALDVHDGPMQELVAAGFALSTLRVRLEDERVDPAAVRSAVDTIARQLGVVEQGLRSVIFSLEHGGEAVPLRDAVEEVVATARARSRAEIGLRFEGAIEATTDSQRIALCQVVRESLANALRHADAKTIRVRVAGTDRALHVEVADDGRGFDPQAVASAGGGHQVGLAGMRERLRLLGGTFAIDSRPGGGTTVTARLEKWQPDETEPGRTEPAERELGGIRR